MLDDKTVVTEYVTVEAPSDEAPFRSSEKDLVRRIDLRLVPILVLIYAVNFLDRLNISNAMTLGLQKDLKLKGNQINVSLCVFFATYIFFELPSNIMLKKFKPHVWLPLCLFGCGLVTLGQGFVKNYAGLVTARLFLGLFEAGAVPGCSYLLTMWYKRDEALRRYALFFNGAALAGAFGSLLASGLAQMDGVSGIAGWRWIFIIEGSATCAIAIGLYFIVTDFPEDAKWLSSEDKQLVLERLKADQPDAGTHVPMLAGVRKHISDPKSYCIGLMYFGLSGSMYALAYFLPTVLQQYGYGRIQIQLHAAAPFAVGLSWSVGLCFLSAKINQRLILVLLTICLALSGVGILLNVHHNRVVMYGATFLYAMGVLGAAPLALCWYFMNLRGHTERAIGTAWVVGAGNCGGIVSTFSFLKKDAPRFHKGYTLCTLALCLAAVAVSSYAAFCRLANRSRSGATKLAAY